MPVAQQQQQKELLPMLTVKHISLSGNETLYSAYEVEFRPSESARQCFTRSPIEAAHAGGSLCLTKPAMNPGEIGTYTLGLEGGTAFVMNDHGKTVSRYDLGASMVPLNADAARPQFSPTQAQGVQAA